MKLKIFKALLLGLTLMAGSQFRFGQWKPTITEDDRLKGSYRFERNGWVYVHLEGAPEQIGLSARQAAGERDRGSAARAEANADS